MENLKRIFSSIQNEQSSSSSLLPSSSSSSSPPPTPGPSFVPETSLFPQIGSRFQYHGLPVICWQPMVSTCSYHRWSLTEHLAFRHLCIPNVSLDFNPELKVLTGMLKDEREKPAQSYIGLIATAIMESKEKRLLLGDIYKWVLKNYPYFRSRGSGWRNSIRHNLSLNDCFVKAGRSASGKGHYWSIHKANVADFSRGDFRRKKALRKAKRAMIKTATQETSWKEVCCRTAEDERDPKSQVQAPTSEQDDRKPPQAVSGKSFDVRVLLGIN